MNIFQPHDFFFAALWALVTFAIHRFAGWLKAQVEADNTISARDAKICHYGLLVLRGVSILTAVFSIGTIVLPLLDALLTTLLGTASDLFNKYGGLALIIAAVVIWWKNRQPKQATAPASVTDVDIELARQKAMDMQGFALSFMLRVLIAISSFTPVIRPRNIHDIEVRSTDGASFYMKDDVAIQQAEVEVEGEITPEVEDTLQRTLQNYAQKYITDYPMLISPEAGGRAPVEVLGVKNCGSRVLIDYVFTSAKSVDMINARRRARVERQMKQERPAPYTDPDYGE
ncbi:hypothetical protein [Vermiculatibacterium agrestimuris]|uniref:hypothetical protein n=1 Tax=Vermiculatibacterium agrestimuris TaxID=2941519 RepID=UPI00203F0046|nr:hypothetical protein [Vermiculatibacterium agrestimuris]